MEWGDGSVGKELALWTTEPNFGLLAHTFKEKKRKNKLKTLYIVKRTSNTKAGGVERGWGLLPACFACLLSSRPMREPSNKNGGGCSEGRWACLLLSIHGGTYMNMCRQTQKCELLFWEEIQLIGIKTRLRDNKSHSEYTQLLVIS